MFLYSLAAPFLGTVTVEQTAALEEITSRLKILLIDAGGTLVADFGGRHDSELAAEVVEILRQILDAP